MKQFESNVLSAHMGADFEKLSPLLRRVHCGAQYMEGVVKVEHGNPLAKIICHIFKFPKANSQCHLRVECYHSGDSMQWIRYFDDHKMESNFVSQGHYLVERLGPLDLYFSPLEENGELTYQFVFTRIWGIPLPKILGPNIYAREYECDGKYKFEVRVHMLFIGLVLAYGGTMQLRENLIYPKIN